MVTRKPNRVGRPKPGLAVDDAQLKIREEALALFAARNFSAVTIKDIAKATGFNTALIYYYFGSKDELFRSAVTLAVERAFYQFSISRQTGKPPGEVVFDWLDTHVREYETISMLIRISIDYASSANRKPRIDRAIRKFYDDEREVLRSTLQAGIDAGDFPSLDVDEWATFISTYLDGVFVRAMMLRDFEPITAIASLKSVLTARLSRS